MAIYLGLLVHAQARRKELIDKLRKLGLSVSYDRVLSISAAMANSVCMMYEEQNIVCPPKLKKDILITASVDNIDHNPSARTAKDSFHGTVISLTQHPYENTPGTDRWIVVINPSVPKQKGILELPAQYTNLEPLTLKVKDYKAPAVQSSIKISSELVDAEEESQYQWIKHVVELLYKEQLEKHDYSSWAAYHVSLQQQSSRSLAIIALLPLFREVAHSAAMTLHSMKIIKNAVEYLNPGQEPVVCLGQPLFAIAKQIQWERKHIYGEDKVVIMTGALHIEMTALIVIGDRLKDSGWESVLVNANISTPGRVNAMLKASHVTRTGYAHQVTASVLYILQKRAYDEYVAVTDDNQEPIGFHDWCKAQADQYPQFKYWLTVPELEILVLGFVKSLRVGDFPLYVQSLNKLAPWMFALNHYNYARWL